MKRSIIATLSGVAFGVCFACWALRVGKLTSGVSVISLFVLLGLVGFVLGLILGKSYLSAWVGLYLGQLAVCPFRLEAIASILDPDPELIVIQVALDLAVLSLAALPFAFAGYRLRKRKQLNGDVANKALHGIVASRAKP